MVQRMVKSVKTYIVNMAEIVKYIRSEGGQVLMSNNVMLDVSGRRKDEFLKMLDKV